MSKMLIIGYIKILELLIYILNYKVNKKGKLNDKSKCDDLTLLGYVT